MGTVVFTIFLLLLAVAGVISARIASKKIKEAKKSLTEGAPVDQPQSTDRNRRGSFSSVADYDTTAAERDRKKKLKSSIAAQSIVRWASSGISAVAVLLVLLMCVTTVSAKNVGVAVNFGAVSENTLSPGIKFKLPWTKVVEIDGTIQTDQYEGDGCIPVRIGDGSQACASITNRWQINPANASSVYEDHRSDDPTESFRSAIVDTELKQSIQEALKNYNPIAQLQAVGGDELSTDLSFAPEYGEISQVIQSDMEERLARTDQATIEGITFSYLKLSDNTQRKLDDYIAEVGATRIALQQQETAKAQAEANRQLSSSVSNDPNVLVSRCLDFLEDASQAAYSLPAGFSCWPGGGSAVVVPGAPATQPTQ